MKKQIEEKKNTCGVIGVWVGWFVPIAGLTLGIIALARKEKHVAWGIVSIIESVFFWLVWMAVYLV